MSVGARSDGEASTSAAVRVAYVMSRFPKLTETFVLNEILAVEAAGAQVDIYPLLRERPGMLQPGAAALVERARYQPFLSLSILASQAWWLVRRPRRYLGALGAIIRDGWGSPVVHPGRPGHHAQGRPHGPPDASPTG